LRSGLAAEVGGTYLACTRSFAARDAIKSESPIWFR
jgi:hypothetical protein